MDRTYKITNKEWLFVVLFAVCIFAAFVLLFTSISDRNGDEMSQEGYDKELISYNEEWTVSDGIVQQEDTSLPFLADVNKDTTISISKKLPESLMGGTYLGFRSDNVFISVYIDSQLIYSSSGLNISDEVTIAGEKWNFVSLSPEHSGKIITVTFYSPYRYYTGLIPCMTLGTLSEVRLYSLSSASGSVYLSIGIIAIGLIMLLLSILNTLTDASLRSYAYLSIYVTLLGLMMVTKAQLPRSYENGYYIEYVIFHIALRLSPILYCLYCYVRIEKKYRNLLGTLILFDVCSFLACSLLHYVGVYDFTESLWLAVFLFTIPLLLNFYFDVMNRRSASLRYKVVTAIGVCAYFGGLFSEIVLRASFWMSGSMTMLIACILVFAVSQSIGLVFLTYELASEQIKIAKELEEKRVKLMMSQMQPHFIYNALSIIRGMTLEDPEKAYEMIYHFSNYLKHNIASLKDNDLIPFSKELEHINAYTAIECERFKDQLSVVYDIRTVNFLIPPLTVEPFVENAIKHGIRKRAQKGVVTIRTEMKENYYLISIIDDGVGFDISVLQEKYGEAGIGIENASYRLRELMGAHVNIKSMPGCGCTVSIIVPKVLSEGDLG